MTDAISLMLRHRSIRRYADQPIPDADVRRAVEAGQAASTSSAVQSYCVIRVTDPEHRDALAELTGPQEKVARCGAFFVVCGDTRRHRLLNARSGRPYAARLEAFLIAVIDATLFAQNFALAFESMGYGICYIGGLRSRIDEVDRLLEMPEGVYPLYGLCAGVPRETPAARPRLPVEAVLFEARYPDDETMLRHIDAYDEGYRRYLAERGARPDQVRPWSAIMTDKFSEPRRPQVGAYYTRKGADLS